MPQESSEGLSPTEIGITPAMIDAGEYELLGKLGGAVTVHWDARDLAMKVYRAMKNSALAEEL